MFRGVHRPHAALANDLEDLIAIGEDRPHLQMLAWFGFGGFRRLHGWGFGHGRAPSLQQPDGQANRCVVGAQIGPAPTKVSNSTDLTLEMRATPIGSSVEY